MNRDDTNYTVMPGAHVAAVTLAVHIFHEQAVAGAE
jgi:hypothetical protein